MKSSPSVTPPLRRDHRPAAGTTAPDPTLIEGRVYLACPVHVFESARARRLAKLARRRFPNAEVLPARDQFASTADWLRRWPQLLPGLAAVCVFGDDDGWVGKGVWDELRDALARGIPVFVLTNKRVHRWDEVALVETDGRNWRRYARLHLRSDPAGGRDA